MTFPGREGWVRLAHAGLLLSGAALLSVLGTGGTSLDLGRFSIPLQRVFPSLLVFGAFAALRLLLSSRTGGIEGRILRILARQGLSPRDLPSTPARAARAGALLGAGFGAAIAVADATHVAVTSGSASVGTTGLLAAFLVSAVTAIAAVALVGALAGAAVVRLFPRLAGRRAGRYEAGRWTAALLLVVGPLATALGPAFGSIPSGPAGLLATAAAFLAGLVIFCVAVPAAWLQISRGRYSLALLLLAGIALVGTASAIVGALRAGEAAPTAPYPNILLVTVTGLRADAVSAYGAAATATPAIDELAKQGALFSGTVTPSRYSPAAAASLLTGLYPASHGLRGPRDRLRPGLEGVADLLAETGYRSGGFVSARGLEGRRTGLGSLFERYEDATSVEDWLARFSFGRLALRVSPRPVRPTRDARQALGRFRDWVGGLPAGAPWFAWIEIGDPAWPWPAPPRGGSDAVALPIAQPELSAPLGSPPSWSGADNAARPLASWIEGYREAVAEADRAIEALQQLLLERGELRRTLIVVTAERGVPLGEGGRWFELGPGLEEAVERVPWVMAGPGVTPGTRIPGPTSLVDVAPTLLGLLRLGSSSALEGEDLSRFLQARVLEERAPGSGPVFGETPAAGGACGTRSVRIGRFKLVREPDGTERLFEVTLGTETEVEMPQPRAQRVWEELAAKLDERVRHEAEFAAPMR